MLREKEAVDVYAISVDPPAQSKSLIQKLASDGKGAVPFQILSDAGHKTVDAYGLYDPAYAGQPIDGVPHPAVYVIGKDGTVVWAKVEEDYRERPSNDEIRKALDGLTK